MTDFKRDVLEYVKLIPEGKLINFVAISDVVGGTAQSVGWVLSGLSAEECEGVPWHRVVAKDGYISALKLGEKGQLQKILLLEEGFEIVEDRVDIKQFLWSNDNQDDQNQSLF